MLRIDFDIKEIYDVVKNEEFCISNFIVRDGFVFTSITTEKVFDALVVKEHTDKTSFCEFGTVGTRTIDECIELINWYRLESAVFITNNLSILKQCPTVKNFTLYLDPAGNTVPKYDSLYLIPGVKKFSLGSKYGIDELYICGKSPLVFQKLKTLKILNMRGIAEISNDIQARITTIEDFDLPELVKLSILQCGITSLKGIQNCPKLQWLDFSYMRNLSDISELSSLAHTLRMLSFENCPKITDLSVISKLKELEYLELKGNNELFNLDFIKEMPKLKFLNLTMNVRNGDISPCLSIPYADVKGRKHYNLKNKDLPKNIDRKGFYFL